jgi:hypothetical protein
MKTAQNLWSQLERSGGFASETMAGNKFRLWIEGDTLKIEIHAKSGRRNKSLSRARFERWHKMWFKDGERRLSAFQNETGKSKATNIAYVAHFFRSSESSVL